MHLRPQQDTIAPKQLKVRKRDVTFGFFSPINQHLSFGYEQPVTSDIILSGHIGIIGLGLNVAGSYPTSFTSNPTGAYVSCGAKMFFNPDYWINGMYRYNKMQGLYFMPEIVAGYFNYYSLNYFPNINYPNPYYYQAPTTVRNGVTHYALLLNLGKQWVLANVVILNIYAGIGYGGFKLSGPYQQYLEPDLSNFYDYLSTGSIAVAAGVDIGVLLK